MTEWFGRHQRSDPAAEMCQIRPVGSAASEQTAASSGELEQLGQQLRGMVGRFNI